MHTPSLQGLFSQKEEERGVGRVEGRARRWVEQGKQCSGFLQGRRSRTMDEPVEEETKQGLGFGHRGDTKTGDTVFPGHLSPNLISTCIPTLSVHLSSF